MNRKSANTNPHPKIKKGDQVIIISGKEKGAKGKVLKVLASEGRVIVEGIQFMKKHARKTQKNPQGGIEEREAPVDISNVMLVCPKCGKPTKIGFHFLEDGTKTRICRKCREMIET